MKKKIKSNNQYTLPFHKTFFVISYYLNLNKIFIEIEKLKLGK